MMRFRTQLSFAFGTLALAALVMSGCGTPNDKATSQPTAAAQSSPDPEASETDVGNEAGHDHSDWWCAEHGVPEEECTRCDSSLIAEFKSKGDWCDEHARPHSQCFLCDPELEAKFAARYVAKFGEQPPKPTDP